MEIDILDELGLDSDTIEEVVEENEVSDNTIEEAVASTAELLEESLEEPSTQEEVTQDEFDDDTPLNAREIALLARIEELSQGKIETSSEASTSIEQIGESASKDPASYNMDFIGETDLDEAFASKDSINALLNRVYSAALEKAKVLSAEGVYQNLPKVVSQYVTQQMVYNRTTTDFFEKNKDLLVVSTSINQAAARVATEHPEYTLEKVFEESGRIVRTALRLRANSTTNRSVGTKLKPAFVNTRSGTQRSRRPQANSQKSAVLDLITD